MADDMKMQFTGERFTPECEGEIRLEHWQRYLFARSLVKDKRVLDVACGEGYGSKLLAEQAASVVGVDVSVEVIEHATRRYGSLAGLGFRLGDCERLDFPDASFDVIVSFETIEHVPNQEQVLAELRRILAPDGVLIISTPNKKTYSDDRAYQNEFHVREFYRAEFESFLKVQFPRVHLYGQKLMMHSVIWPEACQADKVTFWVDGQPQVNRIDYEPLYFIAVCGATLPETEITILGEETEWLLPHYEAGMRKMIELDRIRHEQEQQLSAQSTQLVALQESLTKCSQRVMSAETELAHLKGAVSDQRQGWSWFRGISRKLATVLRRLDQPDRVADVAVPLPASKEPPTLDAVREPSLNPGFRSAVWRHFSRQDDLAGIAALKTLIHANDQMLLHSLNHHHDVNLALSQYYNVALQQHDAARQILRGLFGKRTQDATVLDFACGYGRLLRFLTLEMPPSRIWASDIQEDATDFVCHEFGVSGLKSSQDPTQFEPGRKFDFIWVASLFSHLPDRLFRAWLEKLWGLLEPDGVLCISVHDECLLPAGAAMPESGIHFVSSSENVDLDPSAYGTTYVTEDFVKHAISADLGPAVPYFRIRRGLANEQDVYVIPKNPDRDLAPLKGFRWGPWGWVDGLRFQATGELELRGWAASLDEGAIDHVEIMIDGIRHRCPTGQDRPDVARVLGDDRFASSGWTFKLALPEVCDAVFLEVSAPTRAGERALIYVGRVEKARPDNI